MMDIRELRRRVVELKPYFFDTNNAESGIYSSWFVLYARWSSTVLLDVLSYQWLKLRIEIRQVVLAYHQTESIFQFWEVFILLRHKYATVSSQSLIRTHSKSVLNTQLFKICDYYVTSHDLCSVHDMCLLLNLSKLCHYSRSVFNTQPFKICVHILTAL